MAYEPVPPPVRELIQEATDDFTFWSGFEVEATPVKDAEKLLAAVEKNARRLLSSLRDLNGSGVAALCVKDFIAEDLGVRVSSATPGQLSFHIQSYNPVH